MRPPNSVAGKLPQGQAWVLLAEFPWPEMIANENRTLEGVQISLIEAASELGLVPAQLSRIKGTLVDALRNASELNTLKGTNLPITIRLYYQEKKPILPEAPETFDADIVNPIPNVNGTGPPEVVQKAFEPDTPADKGWGYFLTERKIDTSGYSSGESTSLIELFLYTEEK
jgi:hypothetical protein